MSRVFFSLPVFLYALPLVVAVVVLGFFAFALVQAIDKPAGQVLGTPAPAEAGRGLNTLLQAELLWSDEWQELTPKPKPLHPEAWGDSERYVLLNFFASWCAPCHAEHPQLMRLSEVLPVYGILWRDRVPPTIKWLKAEGNPFHRVGGSLRAVDEALAIRGVPSSFLLDLGELDLGEKNSNFAPNFSEAKICWRGDAPLLGGDDLTWQSLHQAFATCAGGELFP